MRTPTANVRLVIPVLSFIILNSCTNLSSTLSDAETVNQRFRAAGIKNGFVQIDAQNRLILKGDYESDAEVDKAFSIAQTAAGVRNVSPVTPSNVKVKVWATTLSLAMGKMKKQNSLSTTSTTGVKIPSRPSASIANKYALLVGISNFRAQVTPLKYAVGDATTVKDYLLDKQGGNFTAPNIEFLSNEQATRTNIENALDELQNKAGENDLVFIYFSTHGAPPNSTGKVSIVTYDTEVKPRENIWQTSLNKDKLESFIKNVRSKRLIIVLDTCYSGGAYSGITGFLASGSKSLEDDELNYNVSLGAKDLVIEDDAIPVSHETQNWGKMLISASSGGEKSWEPSGEPQVGNINNSFFTHYFIEGMRKHQGDVRQAFNYAQPEVSQIVQQVKHNQQHPELKAFYPNANVVLH